MIATERLILRPAARADFDESLAMWSDPEVARFIAATIPTRAEVWAKLLRNIGHWAALGSGIFTIRDRASGAFVGEAGLARFERGLGDRFDPFPEAAWVLAEGARRKGYAAEAVGAVHAWARAQGLGPRSVCIIHPDNAASLRLAGRLGYRAFAQATYRGIETTMFERGA